MDLGDHLKMIESSQCSAFQDHQFQDHQCIDFTQMVGYHNNDDNVDHQVGSSRIYPTIVLCLSSIVLKAYDRWFTYNTILHEFTVTSAIKIFFIA